MVFMRQNKEHKNLNYKINKPVSDSIERFIGETGMTKTATVENALAMYIEHYYKTGQIKYNSFKRSPKNRCTWQI